MSSQSHMQRKARGFTLTEAAIVLGIVGLILGAIWVAAAAVYKNMRVTRTTEQILNIVQNMRSLHATQTSVGTTATAALTAALAQAGVFPKDMTDMTTTPPTITNAWNGAVTIASAQSSGGSAGDSFAVTYASMPQDACADMAVRMTGPGRDGGLIGVSNGGAANGTNFPIDVTTAIGICTPAGAATTIPLTFTFRLRS